MLSLLRLLVLLLLASSFAAGAPAQDPKPAPSGNPAQGNTVKLRVLDPNSGPVQSVTVTLLRVFDIKGLVRYGKVPNWPDRTLQPRDFLSEHAALENLPTGKFALRVQAEPFAMALSPAFEVTATAAPVVEVRLSRGTVLTGIVQDEKGKPLADAEVHTEAPLAIPSDKTIGQVLGAEIAMLVTEAGVKTDKTGRYRFTALARGKYRFFAGHPDHVDVAADCEVGDERPIELPPITLPRGCAVAGTATLDGKPAAGIEVLVTPPNPDQAPMFPGRSFRTISGADGSFRFEQRIPTGAWRIAARQPLQKGESVFATIPQTNASRRALDLVPDGDVLDVALAIQSR